MKPADADAKFWFNTATREVEHGPQSLALNRLGPFETAAEALRAEEIVAERARKIAAEDEAEDA
jgi:hypothetical protein